MDVSKAKRQRIYDFIAKNNPTRILFCGDRAVIFFSNSKTKNPLSENLNLMRNIGSYFYVEDIKYSVSISACGDLRVSVIIG